MECTIINSTPYAGVDIIFKISWQWSFIAKTEELEELLKSNEQAQALQKAELYAVTIYQGSYAKSALQLSSFHMKVLREAIDKIEMGTRSYAVSEHFA